MIYLQTLLLVSLTTSFSSAMATVVDAVAALRRCVLLLFILLLLGVSVAEVYDPHLGTKRVVFQVGTYQSLFPLFLSLSFLSLFFVLFFFSGDLRILKFQGVCFGDLILPERLWSLKRMLFSSFFTFSSLGFLFGLHF
jgi:hypothetical protein